MPQPGHLRVVFISSSLVARRLAMSWARRLSRSSALRGVASALFASSSFQGMHLLRGQGREADGAEVKQLLCTSTG